MNPQSQIAKTYEMLRQAYGQGAVLTVPRLFLTLLDGDATCALFLSQCLYWSDKGSRKDCFYKTSKEWHEELGIGDKTVRRCRAKLAELGLLSSTVHKAPGGDHAVFYRLDPAALVAWLTPPSCDVDEESKPPIGQVVNGPSGELENSHAAGSLYSSISPSVTASGTGKEEEERSAISQNKPCQESEGVATSPPSWSDVEAYACEIEKDITSTENWYEFCKAGKWTMKGQPIRNWKQALIAWRDIPPKGKPKSRGCRNGALSGINLPVE